MAVKSDSIIMQRLMKVKRVRHWNIIFRLILIIFIGLLCWLQMFNNNETEILKDTEFAMTSIKALREFQTLLKNNNRIKTKEIITILDNDDDDNSEIDDDGNNEDLYNVQLKRIVKRLNAKQTVRNLHKYGSLTNDSLIIVVQVHNRLNYLYETINSLSKARGIEDVLLIFSHDYYDESINRLVRGIQFCKTMQIFFPYSTQIYTNIFPGRSSHNDCPQNAARKETAKINCFNVTADQYGNYRDAAVAQVKHHWWWKVNTVFNRIVRNYTGLVLFMEEDHYMVDDFIYVLKLMQRTLPECEIFSLGEHGDKLIFSKIPQVHLSNWISNLGISFNRSVWNALVECADKFCYYDDYNWDWSLQSMTKSCPSHTFRTSTLQDSRIYHMGICGMHYHQNCSDMSHVVKYKETIKSLDLYPERLEVIDKYEIYQMSNTGYGGWADIRDHMLCMYMTLNH